MAVAADGGNAVIENNSGGGGGNEGWSTWGLYQGHPYLGHIQGHGANVPYQPDFLHAGFLFFCHIVNSIYNLFIFVLFF